jgi:Leucine-rich repeat (LRR) protein
MVTHLDLAFNQIARLPNEIGHLVNLKELLLEHNVLEELPASMGRLSRLEVLHLQNNRLTWVPETLAALTNLKSCKTLLNRFDFNNNDSESSVPLLQDLCLTVMLRSKREYRADLFFGSGSILLCPKCRLPFVGSAVSLLKRGVLANSAQCMMRSFVCSPSCLAKQKQEDTKIFSGGQVNLEELSRSSLSIYNMNRMIAVIRNNPVLETPKRVFCKCFWFGLCCSCSCIGIVLCCAVLCCSVSLYLWLNCIVLYCIVFCLSYLYCQWSGLETSFACKQSGCSPRTCSFCSLPKKQHRCLL